MQGEVAELGEGTSVARQLRARGYAVDRLDPGLAERVRAVLAEAPAFFDAMDDLPPPVLEALRQRRRDGRAVRFTGFRMPGEEYAQAYERPDIMQSFSLMAGDQSRLPAEVWAFLRGHPYVARLFEVREAVVRRADAALRELAAEMGSAAALPDLTRHSFLQVNCYRPALFERRYRRPGDTPLGQRRYLQDPHEDGQFLTWAAADAWGLVGRPMDGDGELQPIPPSPERMLVMPSLPFTYYTGGPGHGGIPAFEHAVLREVDGRPVERRTSLICFVNPDVTQELEVLAPSPENRGLSVPWLVNEAQWRFGLPRYEEPERVAADGPARQHTMALVERLYGAG